MFMHQPRINYCKNATLLVRRLGMRTFLKQNTAVWRLCISRVYQRESTGKVVWRENLNGKRREALALSKLASLNHRCN